MIDYFSDQEHGPVPPVQTEITLRAWRGLAAHVDSLLCRHAFANSFPETCPDGSVVCGTNATAFISALQAEVPGIPWPLLSDEVPAGVAALDLMQFCHWQVASPNPFSYHGFFRHHHFRFDVGKGRQAFRTNINRILSRNGLAFELLADGAVRRLVGPVLGEKLAATVFQSGDAALDDMLEAARAKFQSADPVVRRESLKELWDGWERLKTINIALDKKDSVKAMLDNAAPELAFRELLEVEAVEVTRIGNSFQIRHTETDQVPVGPDAHVDYLFHRLFALIWLLLRSIQ